MMKKLVFMYLDTKFPNKLRIEKDTSYLSPKSNPNEKYFALYSGETICVLYIYSSGHKLHYTHNSIAMDLESWFGLSLLETDEIVFEWVLNKESNSLVYYP